MSVLMRHWSYPLGAVLTWALDEALKALSEVNSRRGQVVELRFYGGLSVEETAGVLKVSPETVMRDWKLAKLWLLREMSGGKQVGA